MTTAETPPTPDHNPDHNPGPGPGPRSIATRAAAAAFRRLPSGSRERLLDGVAAQPSITNRVLNRTRAAVPGAGGDDLRGALAGLLVDGDGDVTARLIDLVAERVPFETWERHGWHLTPNHFYSVIPDTGELPELLWKQQSELPGVDVRDAAQVELARAAAGAWGAEYDALPREAGAPDTYFVNNHAFESVDAEIYYSLIRTHKPRRILEIGAGWSSLLADRALAANQADGHPGELVSIEPYPYEFTRRAAAASPRIDLRVTPLQSVGFELVESLGENDILFIDSSHVCKIGSDVQYEFLELLPRVRPGVLVHVHDIFLPGEYPRDWVMGDEHRFWNEQYVLQAFLAFNAGYEVVWGSAYMHARHPDVLEATIGSYDRQTRFPGSFWMRRTTG